jgi:hypothetical protein
MVLLSREILTHIVEEYGARAVNESLRETGPEWGLFAAGGEGAASKKSPAQIAAVCDRLGRAPDVLVHGSRTAAKVKRLAVFQGT